MQGLREFEDAGLVGNGNQCGQCHVGLFQEFVFDQLLAQRVAVQAQPLRRPWTGCPRPASSRRRAGVSRPRAPACRTCRRVRCRAGRGNSCPGCCARSLRCVSCSWPSALLLLFSLMPARRPARRWRSRVVACVGRNAVHPCRQRVEELGHRAHCASQSSMAFISPRNCLAARQRRARTSRCACARCARRCSRHRARSARCRCSSSRRRTSATSGGASCVPVARKCAISRKIHGRPCAARPTITASAPVSASTSRAFSGESMSPLATTGTRTAAFTAAMVSYSASPL